MTTDKGLLVAVICAAPFVVVLDSSIVSVALPAIRQEFATSGASVQWVVTAYALAFGGLLLVGGRAADLHGRRLTLMRGLIAFTAASVAGACAPSVEALVAMRAVQGLGAAFALPAALSLLTSTFEEGRERNRALGTFGMLISVAAVSGVAIGGAVTEWVGWRGVLLINVPIAVAAVLAAPSVVAETARGGEQLARDLPRAVAATAGLVGLLLGLTEAGRLGWGAWQTIASLALGAVALALAVVADRRAARPLVTPALLRRRTVVAATVGACLAVGTGIGVVVVLSLYLQEVLGYGPLHAGLLLMPLGVAGVLAGKVCPRLADRLGAAAVLAGALTVEAMGVALMVLIGVTVPVGVILVGVGVLGLGLYGANVAFTALASSGIEARDQGVAVGVLNAGQQIGAGFGLALLVTVAALRTAAVGGSSSAEEAVVDGYRWALLTGVALSELGAVLVLVIMYRRSRASRV